jgi:DNA modification methylase
MAEMEPESVHCVVTSPPYWGLRDYGTATWIGGDEACDHLAGALVSAKSGLRNDGREHVGPYAGEKAVTTGMPHRSICGKCGATRVDSQLGLEPTPEAYVESMVAVFREVKRVLRSDGTVWLNLGDSYAGSSQTGGTDVSGLLGYGNSGTRDPKVTHGPKRPLAGLKPKDLVGIPWRVAFALQADGWYLRSDIIWAKPNPMPESVTDRPTKSHEYLFLLSKSPRYYYDADAVREENSGSDVNKRRAEAGLLARASAKDLASRSQGGNGRNPDSQTPYGVGGRNLRSVWNIATQPYPGAHFATFPQALVEPCIKAGTSEKGVCPGCGDPWERVVEKGEFVDSSSSTQKRRVVNAREVGRYGTDQLDVGSTAGSGAFVFGRYETTTTGWRPSCPCVIQLDPVPAIVLDPFAGSGTTGLVAQRLSRRAVLIDLNGDYLDQVMERNRDIPLGLGA